MVIVKATNEIVEVTECFDSGYSDRDGCFYESSEVEVITKSDTRLTMFSLIRRLIIR